MPAWHIAFIYTIYRSILIKTVAEGIDGVTVNGIWKTVSSTASAG
jgi:hypothetical protein